MTMSMQMLPNRMCRLKRGTEVGTLGECFNFLSFGWRMKEEDIGDPGE